MNKISNKKIKVAHIINSLDIGGAEKLVVDIIKNIDQSRFLLDIIVLAKTDSFFVKELENSHKKNIVFLTENKRQIYNPLLIYKIFKLQKKYDVLHLHLFPTLYWGVIANIFTKKNIIYTEHSTENRRRNSLVFKYIEYFIYRRINVITCITNSTKENLVNHIGAKHDIKVINNGINLTIYNVNSVKYPFFKDFFKLIQVSSFRAQKDQLTILRSMMLLPNDVGLILVGDGPLRLDCEKFVEENGLKDRVIFLGNREDVSQLLNYSDVAVLSSHYEGFGLAILEGMAAHKPAIASNVKGVREIVKGFGLLFEKGNEKQLAKYILQLKGDKKYYQNIADKCYQRSKNYDINKMLQEFMQIYTDVYQQK